MALCSPVRVRGTAAASPPDSPHALTHVSENARNAVLLFLRPRNSRGNALPATGLQLMVARTLGVLDPHFNALGQARVTVPELSSTARERRPEALSRDAVHTTTVAHVFSF